MDKSADDLKDYNRKQLTEYMQLLLFEKAGIKYKGASQETKQKMKSLKTMFNKKLEEDVEKYRDYEFNRDKYITGRSQKQIIDTIIGMQDLQRVNAGLGEEKEDIRPSGQKKEDENVKKFDDAQAKFEEVYEKNKGKETTIEMVNEFMKVYDKLKDVDKKVIQETQHPATEDSSKIVAEATLIIKGKLKDLSDKSEKDEEKEVIKKTQKALDEEAKDYRMIRIKEGESEIASDKELQRIRESLGMLYLEAKDRRRRKAEMSEMLGAEEGKEELEQKEDYKPKPVIGTDYQGSKEMFVKPEQKPLEPFGGLRSQNEVEAPYLSTKSDKEIGNVRSIGFIGGQDQLAKVDDVTMEPSERSKSLKRFTNFRWVQSVQNSDLGYASPFQRMDDIDDMRRYGKCFMHASKMPKDPDTQDELDKAKGFNTYPLVPSFKLSSRMQPAGNLSFINSTSKFARKLTVDEMEPINQGKRNVNNVKNKLEFTTILHSDDPLLKIRDKYKNNIVC